MNDSMEQPQPTTARLSAEVVANRPRTPRPHLTAVPAAALETEITTAFEQVLKSMDQIGTNLDECNRIVQKTNATLDRMLGASTLLDTVLSAFTGLGYALSARALLLLTLIGAFVLAMRADGSSGIAVLVAYALFTVIPVVILEVRKR